MSKFFLRFFLIVLIVVVSATIFLSYFGIETDKFDSLIKSKANEVNRYVKLGFQKTKIYINPTKRLIEPYFANSNIPKETVPPLSK